MGTQLFWLEVGRPFDIYFEFKTGMLLCQILNIYFIFTHRFLKFVLD